MSSIDVQAEHKLSGKDSLGAFSQSEQAVHRRFLMAPAPGIRSDLMRVHRERERRRATVMGDLPQHVAELGVAPTAAANFVRHAGGNQSPRFQFSEVFCDEPVAFIRNRSALSELWIQIVDQFLIVRYRVHDRFLPFLLLQSAPAFLRTVLLTLLVLQSSMTCLRLELSFLQHSQPS